MKNRGLKFLTLVICTFSLAGGFPSFARATSKTAAAELPKKLPSKKKRTFVDFANQDTAVLAVPTPLDRMLTKSEKEVAVVRSRKILSAPAGDSAEPLSSFDVKPKAIATVSPVAKIEAKIEVPAPEIIIIAKPTATPVPARYEFTGPPAPSILVGPPALPAALSPREYISETTETETFVSTKNFAVATEPAKAMAFLRTGYFNANYKKFDDRMSNNASSLGLAVARRFDLSFGSFEARVGIDAYHAMDQSVTVDNIRMLSARTEVAYWLSHSRVKPGLSLGLGWVDYSIRSYRSVSSEDEKNVTLRTHAKGRAFSIIPATSLRFEIGGGLVIDAQTEFVALLGGESPDAAQGFGGTLAIGWIF